MLNIICLQQCKVDISKSVVTTVRIEDEHFITHFHKMVQDC